ncbi:hypothetical protein D8I24_1208 [Cupriavidus necator H850]|uniref:DUF262 domain-containing protein n=1 Tax=Cupriavidus necator TaxID=106590 RepID=UPI00129E396E|nr:DUF262 domain-containing protein [Cupriavidus necator]KAI3608370.1 hypothetical protein D8I24_1208 [Cupriavidus necator H850]
MKEIQAKTRSVRELLSDTKYGIDYYQREYKWQTKQIVELVSDLTTAFQEEYQPQHERKDVASYGHYFLGSIVISQPDEKKQIVDGQQRLTSLTLLLIYLHNIQKDRSDTVTIEKMIFSEEYGEKSFNLDIPERNECMNALFDGTPYDAVDQVESIQNLIGRYNDIVEAFPAEIANDKALPYFVDWLRNKTQLVEITAYADADAYTIFETMNDRGLSLSNTDMLKGYLLASITDTAKRAEANKEIKHWLLTFAKRDSERDSKEGEADFFKAWLRAKYAQDIRERKKGAKPEDFDLIGTEYHRWVRAKDNLIGLNTSDDFNRWVRQDLRFFARVYLELLEASETLKPGLESVRFNADHGFTQQFQVLLAPLRPTDDEATVKAKLKLTADYLDCWLNRRLWNFKSIDYSTLQYATFLLTKELRNSSLDSLRDKLITRLTNDQAELPLDDQPYLNNWNAKSLHRQLARFTHWLEEQSGQPGRYLEYIVRSGKNAYEIEHLWANHFERHTDEFAHVPEFSTHRNKVGGLVLLPKKINASLNDKPYNDKLEHYQSENLLARSLHPMCYVHNPGFLKLKEETGLPFKAFTEFKKVNLDERFSLYKGIAELLWSADRLKEVA